METSTNERSQKGIRKLNNNGLLREPRGTEGSRTLPPDSLHSWSMVFEAGTAGQGKDMGPNFAA